MIQAAVSGQGVALGRQPLVNDLIQSGALVAPFRQTLVGSRAYFIPPNPIIAFMSHAALPGTSTIEEAPELP